MRSQSIISKIALLTSVFLILSGSARAASQEEYRLTSVCEILAKPKHKNTRAAVIDAELINAWPHGLFLVDRNCPKKGLQVDYSSTDVDQSVADLDKLLLSGKLVDGATGRFRGVIKRDPKTKRLYLFLQTVLGLQPKDSTTTIPDIEMTPNASMNWLPHRPGRDDVPGQH